ncbi:MAG: 8-amino-7-oxononanoate synthase [Thermoguttaceae bacterium]
MNHSTHQPLGWIDRELADLDAQGLRRRRGVRDGPQTARLMIDGREMVNFGSNDYLALAADPRLSQTAVEALRNEGCGSGASPLITGYGATLQRLERQLADFEGTEAALVFSSGYAANAGTIAALAGPGDVIFADRKNHASLWDGCRLSRADVRVYPHGDCGRLDELLARAGKYRRRLIATDSLFSMDGDLAPLQQIAQSARRHDAMLLVDEAHATGVFGKGGRGVAEQLGVEDRVDVRIGTLSKALGSVGGFVAGSRSLIEWLVSRARPYVFSTAGPSSAYAAAMAALEIVRDEPGRRERLLAQATKLRRQLAEQGWNTGRSASQIIPLVMGESARAVALAAELQRRGLFVPAIRPPTVPEGEACLRISLTAGHTEAMVAELVETLRRYAE